MEAVLCRDPDEMRQVWRLVAAAAACWWASGASGVSSSALGRLRNRQRRAVTRRRWRRCRFRHHPWRKTNDTGARCGTNMRRTLPPVGLASARHVTSQVRPPLACPAASFARRTSGHTKAQEKMRFVGGNLLRADDWQSPATKSQPPPRNTRYEPVAGPVGSSFGDSRSSLRRTNPDTIPIRFRACRTSPKRSASSRRRINSTLPNWPPNHAYSPSRDPLNTWIKPNTGVGQETPGFCCRQHTVSSVTPWSSPHFNRDSTVQIRTAP